MPSVLTTQHDIDMM